MWNYQKEFKTLVFYGLLLRWAFHAVWLSDALARLFIWVVRPTWARKKPKVRWQHLLQRFHFEALHHFRPIRGLELLGLVHGVFVCCWFVDLSSDLRWLYSVNHAWAIRMFVCLGHYEYYALFPIRKNGKILRKSLDLANLENQKIKLNHKLYESM